MPAVEGLPVVLRERAIELDWDRGGVLNEAWAVELPTDLYWRGLEDLRHGDDRAIAEFVAAHGWFCKPGWTSLPTAFTRAGLGAGALHPRLAGIDALIAGWIEAKRAWRGPEAWRWEEMTPENRAFLHVEEVRVHAEFLRNATRVWEALSGGGSLESVLEAWEGNLGLPQALEEKFMSCDSLELAAWFYLQQTLEAALAEFRVHIELDHPDGRTRGAPRPRTYEALALQLFNDVATDTRFARCQNEPCGRPFPRMPMKEKYNKEVRFYGVKYCSPTCARAQAQRDYRRRKNAEVRGAGGESP